MPLAKFTWNGGRCSLRSDGFFETNCGSGKLSFYIKKGCECTKDGKVFGVDNNGGIYFKRGDESSRSPSKSRERSLSPVRTKLSKPLRYNPSTIYVPMRSRSGTPPPPYQELSLTPPGELASPARTLESYESCDGGASPVYD